MKKLNELRSCLTRLRGLMLTLIILCSISIGNAWGATYVKVTSASDLVSGQVYVIAEISGNTKYLVTGTGSKLENTTSGFNVSNNTITTSTATPLEFTLGTVTSGNNTYYTLKCSSTTYLGYNSSTNFRTNQTATTDSKEQWSITSTNSFDIRNVSTLSANTKRRIARNSASIGPYDASSSSYPPCYLFKKQTSTCTNPTTALSISSANTATVGTNLSLTTTGGNGGSVTWSVTNGTGSATVSGSTLTPTGAGTVTVTATQGENTVSGTTYCGATPTQTINISNATFTVGWQANGTDWTGSSHGSPTTNVESGSKVTTLPTAPTAAACDGSKVFVGWTATPIVGTTNTKPSDLFVTAAAAPNVTENVTYYAVFAAGGTVTFDAATASDLTEDPSLTWTNSTSGVSLTITAGQRYTRGNPYTWSVNKGSYATVAITSGNIAHIEATLSESKYYIKSAGTGTLATNSTTQTITNIFASSVRLNAQPTGNSNNQIRMTTFDVTYVSATPAYETTCCTPPGTALSITGSSTVAMDGTLSLGTSGGNGNTVTWSVATLSGGNGSISSSGVLTPSAVGTVTVTARQAANSYCAQEATLTVTINAATVNVTGVTVSPTTKAIVVGETFTITPTVSPNDATNKSVNWTSANGSIASVSSGTVTGVAAGGPVNITCTTVDGSFTASCATTVYSVTLVVKDEDGTTLSGDGKPTLTRSGASLTATEAGNYVFKDIQVTSGTGTLSSTSSTTPTITSVSSNITVTATFWKPITVTKGTGTGASTYTISATTVARGGSVTVTCAPDASHKNPWTLTITPNDGATYTASGSESSTTISNITKNITVDLAYAAKTPYSLTFSTKSGYGSPSGGKIDETNLSFNASGTVTTPLLEGQTLTFPSVSSFAADECSTTFEGWSTEPNCSTAPTIKSGDELVLSGDPTTRTYYAVYAQTEEGGSGDEFDPTGDVDGDYYITNSDKSYYMSHSNPSVSQYDATIAASKSASTNLFHISKIASGDNAGKFIISFDVSGTTNYVRVYRQSVNGSWKYYVNHTPTAAEATALIIQATAREGATGTFEATYDNTRALMYRNNDGTHSFRNYALNNASTTGYSLLEFEPAASKTYTTNPTCAETYIVTLTGGEGASVDVAGGNVKYNGGTAARFAENDAVSILATPTTGYSFSGWTITKEHGGSVTPASSAASTTFTMPADNVTVTATFSPILVSSLKLRAQQTGQSDKTGSDLTMNCYPKEGQTGGNDPLNHTLNVAFYEVLPADALDKTYTWSVRVKASGAADWTNVDFNGNQLNTNAIINYYNNNTGLLKIGTNEGTAEIKISANDGSGVTAKVTITVANVSVSSISVDPTTMDVYAGQKKPVTITFSPANATDKVYTTGSYTYVTMRSSGSNPFYIEGNATNVVRNEIVTVTSHDGSKTATIDVTVNPLPKATFIDIVHGKTDFLVEGESVLVDGTLTSTVSADGLTVDTEWHTPTHADVAKPATGNNCEKEHLHLVGWILKDWADANPTATHSDIIGAGATNFYGANEAIDLSSASVNGKTYYAVWAKVVTTP